MFDTHKSVKNLANAGFTDSQSEAFVNVLVDALENNANSIKTEIRQDLKEMEHKTELRFKELDVRFKELENKINMILIKVGGVMFSLLLSFKILDRFI